jgi:hypothetical protein
VPLRWATISRSEHRLSWLSLSWISSVRLEPGWRLCYELTVRGSNPGMGEIFLFSKTSRWALGTTRPRTQWVQGSFPGGKAAGQLVILAVWQVLYTGCATDPLYWLCDRSFILAVRQILYTGCATDPLYWLCDRSFILAVRQVLYTGCATDPFLEASLFSSRRLVYGLP